MKRDGKERKSSMWGDVFKRLMRNKLSIVGLSIIAVLVFSAVFCDLLAPYDYYTMELDNKFQPPNAQHWFGTDEFGRDQFSRIMLGARLTLSTALLTIFFSTLIGGTIGIVAAYFKKFDNLIMRVMDVFLAIPNMILAIALAAVLGIGMFNLVLAITLTNIPAMSRLVRSAVLTVKEEQYIEAAVSTGASTMRIILRYIIPNCLSAIIVQATLMLASVIIVASVLSYLGLGIPMPQPEWGAMLSAGKQYLRDYWFLTVIPGSFIVLTVFSFNILGDGLRDAMDPKMRN